MSIGTKVRPRSQMYLKQKLYIDPHAKDDGKMAGSLYHSTKYLTPHTMQERVRYYLPFPTDKISQAYLYFKAIAIANAQAFTARNRHATYTELNHPHSIRIQLSRKLHTGNFLPRTDSRENALLIVTILKPMVNCYVSYICS